MKKYYVQTSINMQPKNKAWEEIQLFAREQDGILLNGEDMLQAFVEQVKLKVGLINDKNPRCKDIEFSRIMLSDNVLLGKVGEDNVFSLELLSVVKELSMLTIL